MHNRGIFHSRDERTDANLRPAPHRGYMAVYRQRLHSSHRTLYGCSVRHSWLPHDISVISQPLITPRHRDGSHSSNSQRWPILSIHIHICHRSNPDIATPLHAETSTGRKQHSVSATQKQICHQSLAHPTLHVAIFNTHKSTATVG